MSDNEPPHKPPHPGLSHLHSEPLSMSFVSPQQLAQLAAGHGFDNIRMQSPHSMIRPQMNPGYIMSDMGGFQTQPVHFNSNHNASATAAAAAATATVHSSSESTSSGTKVFKPLPSQPIDLNTFKGFKFVTLDGLQIETRDIYDQISGTFKWEMCESQEDRCINFIRNDCANRRVFLIASGSLGSKIVPQIHELPQVYAIYIYCANVKYHQEWASKYSKVRTVCDNDDLYLLPQFAVDVAQANVDWGNALFQQGTRDKAKEKFQLALDKLSTYARNHDPTMDNDIKNKLEECK